MATIKAKFIPNGADRKGVVYYQITHDRKQSKLNSGVTIDRSEWDFCRATTVMNATSNERSAALEAIRRRISLDLERLNRIERALNAAGGDYSVSDIVDEYRRFTREYTLTGFMNRIIARMRQNGKHRTSGNYRSTLNSFRSFLSDEKLRGGLIFSADEDVLVDSLTPEMMEAYEAWLRRRGVAPNTSSFYFRILRAVYNRAIEENAVDDRHPFKRVYTGIFKTVKRALPLDVVSAIKRLDLSASASLDYARDMFLMSFMLRGMSLVDMAFLRKSDLRDGHVTYRRRKTGQLLTIKWTTEMQSILDKYPDNPTAYLLPIIRRKVNNEQSAYRNTGYHINRDLKKIALMVGVAIPLTLYVARHSWASAARAKMIPLPVISESMGHDSESTTRIYLADLDTTLIDRANAIIISAL